jgi:hypothetical protein
VERGWSFWLSFLFTDVNINAANALMHKCCQLTVLEMTEGVWISVGCRSQFVLLIWVCSMSLHLHSMTAYCWAESINWSFANSWSRQKHHEINFDRWSDLGPWAAIVAVTVKVIPKPKKVRESPLNVKTILSVSFGCCGLVHYEFFPRGWAVYWEFYLVPLQKIEVSWELLY